MSNEQQDLIWAVAVTLMAAITMAVLIRMRTPQAW